MQMPWGRHEGKRLEEIPVSYLRWVLANCDNAPAYLLSEIRRVLDQAQGSAGHRTHEDHGRREQTRPPVDWPATIRRWHREMVWKYHPDRGGSHAAMVAINDAHERLRQLVGV
jgi:hypothetical protein